MSVFVPCLATSADARGVAPAVDARDLPFPIAQTPDVFTPFRKRVEGLGQLGRPPLDMPSTFKPFPALAQGKSFGGYGSEFDTKDLEELIPALLKPLEDTFENKYSHSGSPRDDKSAFPYAGGETVALKRLEFYFKSGGNPPPVAKYKVRARRSQFSRKAQLTPFRYSRPHETACSGTSTAPKCHPFCVSA